MPLYTPVRGPDTRDIGGPDRAGDSEATRLPLQLDTDAVIALTFLLGSATALGASSVYRQFFKRIKTTEWITPDLLKRKRWITGVVTSVGDADNFRLYHTPGFGWRGPLRFRHVPLTHRELKEKTIHIRMAGIDAPEGAHFGCPAQPYADDALAWLKNTIKGRRIKCQLLRRDQYQRVVALPLLPRRSWWQWTRIGATRNLPLEMIRTGWGVVYEQGGAQYGNWDKELYMAAEAEARAARRGIWQGGTDIETPAEYKKRHRMVTEYVAEPEDVGHEVEKPGLLSRIFGRRRNNTSV